MRTTRKVRYYEGKGIWKEIPPRLILVDENGKDLPPEPSKGKDEDGEWILITLIDEQDSYFEMNENKKIKEIKEEEWKTKEEPSSVFAEMNTSRSSGLTSFQKLIQTCTMAKEKFLKIIGSIF